jgi:hypothetical protein
VRFARKTKDGNVNVRNRKIAAVIVNRNIENRKGKYCISVTGEN